VIPTSPTRAKADLGRLQPDWNLCGNNERTVTNTPWSFPFTQGPQSKTNDQHFRHGLVSASAPPHAGLETRSTPRATPHPNATNAKSQTPSHKRQVTNAKSQMPRNKMLPKIRLKRPHRKRPYYGCSLRPHPSKHELIRPALILSPDSVPDRAVPDARHANKFRHLSSSMPTNPAKTRV